MVNEQPSPVLRLLPSLTDVAFLMPMVFLFLGMEGGRRMLEGDTGWHIRTGEWILANGRVPERDIFSYTKPGEPWFAWEWGWDVIFGWLHQHWGMAAVVLASIVLLGVTFALLFRLTLRKCDNVLIAIGVTLLAIGGSSIHWLARPHLFSLFFVVVFYWVLEGAAEGRIRRLAWLPVLSVFWTNLHGGFFLGILLAGTYGAGELAGWLFGADGGERRAALRRSRPFLLTALGCLAASFVNPYTYRLHLHIIGYLTDSYHLQNINEFLSISFQHPLARFFEVMLALGAVAAFLNLSRKRYVYTFLIAGFAHMALFASRNIPLFLIVAAPVVAAMLQEFVSALQQAPVAGWLRRTARGFEETAREFGAMDRPWRLHLTSAMAVFMLIAVFYAPNPPEKFRADYDPKRYPDRALEVMHRDGSPARIFTNDEWGDYLIYRLYPGTKVFVDGRSDFYGAEFSHKYLNAYNSKYDWQRNLDEYAVDTVLLPVDAPLAGTLKESRQWRVVYDDGMAIVFRCASKAAPGAVEESSIVRSTTGNVRGQEVADTGGGDRRITENQSDQSERRRQL